MSSAHDVPGNEARVDRDGERRDDQVEQELVARLVRVERVAQQASLGHEDVGREQGPEDEREGAGHVHERRQESQRWGDDRHGYAGRGVYREAGCRQGRGGPPPAPPPTTAPAARTGQRPFWKYVSTATTSARTPAAMKYSIGSIPRGRTPGVAREEREQARQEQAQGERVPEAGVAEQERRAEAQPSRRPHRAGEVPRTVQRLVPSPRRRWPRWRRRPRRTPCRRPRRTGRLHAADATGRTGRARRPGRAPQSRWTGTHRLHAPTRFVGRDEAKQQPVENGRGVLVERGKVARIERASPADRAELREERPARDNELGHSVGQADPARGEAPAEVVDKLGRGCLAA